MLKVVLRRLTWAVPLLVVITFFVFFLFEAAHSDPARAIANQNGVVKPTAQQIAVLNHKFGLNGSIFQRYWRWLIAALHGNFGTSYATDQPVTALISQRYSIDLSLTLFALFISLLIAVPSGIFAALHPGKIADRIVTAGSSLAVSVPGFWLAILLVILFAVKLKWFPAIGYVPPSLGFIKWLKSLLLPAVSMGLLLSASIALQLKAAMIDVMATDYILSAEAKGLPKRKIVLKHALKNAAIPVVTVLGFRIAALFGSTVIIESVFNIDGIGALVARSALVGDLPVVVAITAITVAIVVIVNLAVDMSYLYFDPRTRT